MKYNDKQQQDNKKKIHIQIRGRFLHLFCVFCKMFIFKKICFLSGVNQNLTSILHKKKNGVVLFILNALSCPAVTYQ